jgi:hypothetical protein
MQKINFVDHIVHKVGKAVDDNVQAEEKNIS